MREKQIFNNKEVNLDDNIDYNYVEIKDLHNMILNLEINTEDFILMCYLIGNDFLPGYDPYKCLCVFPFLYTRLFVIYIFVVRSECKRTFI